MPAYGDGILRHRGIPTPGREPGDFLRDLLFAHLACQLWNLDNVNGSGAIGEYVLGDLEVATVNFVLAECANAAALRPFRTAIVELHETLRSEHAIIVPTG